MQIVGEVIEHLMGDMYVSQYRLKGQYFDNVTENNQKSMSLKKMLSKSSLPAVSSKYLLSEKSACVDQSKLFTIWHKRSRNIFFKYRLPIITTELD